jgi:DNA invertase Pin-like site-specific DNA recombinase
VKLNFCAVCGTTKDLHQHHIEPVVLSKIDRKKSKKYNGEKKLKDCTSMEVFGWLFDQGIITDDGEITVCSYHHNILHGIVKFQAAEHSKLIREGMKKAQERGIKVGRPKSKIHDKKDEIIEKYLQGESFRTLCKTYDCGTGTLYKIIEGVKRVVEEPVKIGRPTKDISKEQIRYAYEVEKKSVRQICKEYDIGTGTFYSRLRDDQEDLSHHKRV